MLPLPMSPRTCAEEVIAPTFRELLPGKFDSREARVLTLAPAIQESDLAARKQRGGPAMGLWQFERNGGVAEVLESSAKLYTRAVCLLRAVAPTRSDLYGALAHDDLLACAMARLLLWPDAAPLPALGEEEAAFRYYLRNWRPGAYTRDPVGVRARWHQSYAQAMQAYA